MFPWVYGFAWTTGNVIFLGIFFFIVAIIGTTLVVSIFRTVRAYKLHDIEAFRWEVDFHDLPPQLRTCRHEFTGEFKQRSCDNGFDCRSCATQNKLIRHHSVNTDAIELPIHAYGFTIPTDRLYHRGHTWVQGDSFGIYTIGLDDFATRLIGTFDGFVFPEIGSQVQMNGNAWIVKKGGMDLRILSPLDGEVVATNDGSDGWYLKIRPTTAKVDTKHLLREHEVAVWFQREFERLQHRLSDSKIGYTLADGGIPVQDFVKAYPERNWDAILGDVFLEA
jgi:glycine cleavage system H lipoate-binding protein